MDSEETLGVPLIPKTSRKGQRHHRKAQHRLALQRTGRRVNTEVARERLQLRPERTVPDNPKLQVRNRAFGESERPQQDS